MNTVLSDKLIRLIAVISILLFSLFLPQSTFADKLVIPYREYSANNIYFIKECEKRSTNRTTSTTAQASGSSADEKIWSALISLGLTPEVAAGILGNIHNEGSASPVRYEDAYKSIWSDGSFDWENDPAKGHGVGIVQWSGGRRVNLFKHLRDNGASDLVDKYLKHPEKYGSMSGDKFIESVDNPEDANTLYALEIDFLVYEIKTVNEYKGVLDKQSAAEAAEHFSMTFEGCGNGCLKAGSPENLERAAAATQIYDLYHDKTTFSGGNRSSYSNLTPCDCDDGGNLIGGGLYAGAKYNITDEDTLKRLWWAARAEQGVANAKTELTFFVNRFEHMGGTPGDVQGLIASIHNRGPGGREYASTTVEAYNTGVVHWPKGETEVFSTPTSEEISIVKSIIVDGNRTMPIQIVEHDSIEDITNEGWVSNNGNEFSPSDKSQYKTGVTKIKAHGTPYIFYQWANGETVCSGSGCEDPFGYFEDNPPSASTLTTTETGSATWDDKGWVNGGLDGYTKEDGTKTKKLSKTANQDFTTDMPNTKGKGPNKITITTTEGPNGEGTSGLELFKSKKESKPPHFTVNLQDRKIYQHFPIYKTSGANTSTDDGIQIAIIGYTDAEKAKKEKNDKWLLSSLTGSNYDYLTELIRAISTATGIESTNITSPREILTIINKTLSSNTVSDCSNSNSKTGNIIADAALELSWDCGGTKGCKSQGSPPYTPKPEYETAMKQVSTYDDPGGWGYGASCDRFVATVMRYSKADENFPIGYANDSGNYLISHPELYTEINFDGNNYEVLKPGDIFSTFGPQGRGGHIWIYVEINGQQGRADASNGNNSGRTAEHYTRVPIINDGRQYKVFRKK